MREVGLPPLLCSFPPTAAFTSFLLLIAGRVLLLLLAGMFVYSSRGRCVFPPLLWSFPPSATLTSFPAPGHWACALAPTLSCQAQLVYLQFWEGFPSPHFGIQGTPPSLLHVFIVLIDYYCFSFFPRWGSVCPGGYADLPQGCLWKYCIPLTSPCPHLPKPSGCG
jgi:hypothetical protein